MYKKFFPNNEQRCADMSDNGQENQETYSGRITKSLAQEVRQKSAKNCFGGAFDNFLGKEGVASDFTEGQDERYCEWLKGRAGRTLYWTNNTYNERTTNGYWRWRDHTNNGEISAELCQKWNGSGAWRQTERRWMP